MRIVSVTVETPDTAELAAPAAIVAAIQEAAVPQDQLMHVYADLLPGGYGVVVYLLVPLDRAATTGCRLILAAADALELTGWSLGKVKVWDPASLS